MLRHAFATTRAPAPLRTGCPRDRRGPRKGRAGTPQRRRRRRTAGIARGGDDVAWPLRGQRTGIRAGWLRADARRSEDVDSEAPTAGARTAALRRQNTGNPPSEQISERVCERASERKREREKKRESARARARERQREGVGAKISGRGRTAAGGPHTRPRADGPEQPPSTGRMEGKARARADRNLRCRWSCTRPCRP